MVGHLEHTAFYQTGGWPGTGLQAETTRELGSTAEEAGGWTWRPFTGTSKPQAPDVSKCNAGQQRESYYYQTWWILNLMAPRLETDQQLIRVYCSSQSNSRVLPTLTVKQNRQQTNRRTKQQQRSHCLFSHAIAGAKLLQFRIPVATTELEWDGTKRERLFLWNIEMMHDSSKPSQSLTPRGYGCRMPGRLSCDGPQLTVSKTTLLSLRAKATIRDDMCI